VRALFRGPSGTGKTLAATTLARSLQKDLYRVDLGAVVDKYIGETEKNLERLFCRAEELDVALLLDEGDALLGRRTSVHSSNDRYANLETNYLLQRLETSEAIVIVTTNAGERIDDAFLRRMDVVIDFALPEAADRLAIWRLHLPERHDVPADALQEVAVRCVFSGGPIRNAVLYEALMAAEARSLVDWPRLEEAVRREYRKANLVCPLRGRTGRGN
jgi:SpoVK/Ycf46/Vps4 family AAA+-type ATPase